MFKFRTLRALYKDFYAWIGTPALCKLSKNSVLEYSDVFPLIYLKIRLEGSQVQEKVKHLLIDEMQDYTPVQYAVLAALFPCKKTILGDANQSVNSFSSSSTQDIQKVFVDADYVQLSKSYRSTYQITRFAQRISPNAQLEAVERHGPEPSVLSFATAQKEIEEIMRLAKVSAQSGKHSLGIICKTQKQAQDLHRKIKSFDYKSYLLTSQSSSFIQGIIVCAAHMAKGLEFDQVIVVQATQDNYATLMDKSMLYIACTRAMHHLTLTCVGRPTKLIENAILQVV